MNPSGSAVHAEYQPMSAIRDVRNTVAPHAQRSSGASENRTRAPVVITNSQVKMLRARNRARGRIKCMFTVERARQKLGRSYPPVPARARRVEPHRTDHLPRGKVLARRPGIAASRQENARLVWGEGWNVSQSALPPALTRLRDKLGDARDGLVPLSNPMGPPDRQGHGARGTVRAEGIALRLPKLD